jgi:hypothetical protein
MYSTTRGNTNNNSKATLKQINQREKHDGEQTGISTKIDTEAKNELS